MCVKCQKNFKNLLNTTHDCDAHIFHTQNIIFIKAESSKSEEEKKKSVTNYVRPTFKHITYL